MVAACAEAGTDYVDLCGEVPSCAQTIDAHEAPAKETGARIVFSTGFDSVPFDMGVFFLQEQAKAKFGPSAAAREGSRPLHERHLLRRHARVGQARRWKPR